MKIGVDAGCLGIQDERLKVGVYTVVKNLLIELGKNDIKNEYLLYSFRPIEKSLLKAFGFRMKNVVVAPSKGWLKIFLPLRILLDKPNIFIAANQALPLRLPFSKYKVIGIFYDIAFEKYPQLYSYAASVEKHRQQSKNLAEKADVLIAISENTKRDIVKLYNIQEEKIVVAYPGVDKIKKIKVSINKNPYFLFVGAFKKSKNISLIIRAFNEFSKNSSKQYDLYLVGGDKWLDPDMEKTLQSISQTTREHIYNYGFVKEDRLVNFYKNAVAFVSPSLYEGFGLPFLEAQSYGCPVIASTGGSLPEVLGESAFLVDPLKKEKLFQAMEKIAKDNVFRNALIRKGKENVRKYSWKSFGKTVQSAIEQI